MVLRSWTPSKMRRKSSAQAKSQNSRRSTPKLQSVQRLLTLLQHHHHHLRQQHGMGLWMTQWATFSVSFSRSRTRLFYRTLSRLSSSTGNSNTGEYTMVIFSSSLLAVGTMILDCLITCFFRVFLITPTTIEDDQITITDDAHLFQFTFTSFLCLCCPSASLRCRILHQLLVQLFIHHRHYILLCLRIVRSEWWKSAV